MIHQLRIYEIFEGNKAAFHARFRDHAARIMKRYGFDIIAMWEARNEAKSGAPAKTEFVYLLTWPDEAAKKSAWD
ncbi:MAG: NIPSNAP family protein, partial [Alphaproteobacteria bacterium]|nr:NIPSNAP family protein [Alphaproteobacteria bacterium]